MTEILKWDRLIDLDCEGLALTEVCFRFGFEPGHFELGLDCREYF